MSSGGRRRRRPCGSGRTPGHWSALAARTRLGDQVRCDVVAVRRAPAVRAPARNAHTVERVVCRLERGKSLAAPSSRRCARVSANRGCRWARSASHAGLANSAPLASVCAPARSFDLAVVAVVAIRRAPRSPSRNRRRCRACRTRTCARFAAGRAGRSGSSTTARRARASVARLACSVLRRARQVASRRRRRAGWLCCGMRPAALAIDLAEVRLAQRGLRRVPGRDFPAFAERPCARSPCRCGPAKDDGRLVVRSSPVS